MKDYSYVNDLDNEITNKLIEEYNIKCKVLKDVEDDDIDVFIFCLSSISCLLIPHKDIYKKLIKLSEKSKTKSVIFLHLISKNKMKEYLNLSHRQRKLKELKIYNYQYPSGIFLKDHSKRIYENIYLPYENNLIEKVKYEDHYEDQFELLIDLLYNVHENKI